MAAASSTSSAITSITVDASMWRYWMDLSNQGMPKLEMYHQPLVPDREKASTNRITPMKSVRLRADRMAMCDTATAASAASAAPIPAYTPKW